MFFDIYSKFLDILANLITIIIPFGMLMKFFINDIMIKKKFEYVILFILGNILLILFFAYNFISESYKFIISGLIIVIFLVLFFIYSWRKEIKWFIYERSKGYDALILEYINKKDKLVESSFLRFNEFICQASIDSIIAINFGNIKEAKKRLKLIVEILEFIKNHKMAYYVKFALIKSDIFSDLEEHIQRLKILSNIIEDCPEDIIQVLDALLRIIGCKNYHYELSIAESKINELKHTFLKKKYQYDFNSIILQNLELWKKYVPKNQIPNIYNVMIFFIIILIDIIIFTNYMSFITFFIFMIITSYIFSISILFEDRYQYVLQANKILMETYDKSKNNNIPKRIKKFISISNKSFFMWAVKLSLKTSMIIDDMYEIDRIDDEWTKQFNFSLLIYFVTTFPMNRIQNFNILNKKNVIKVINDFKLEKLKKSKFQYFIYCWKIYLLSTINFILSTIKNPKIIMNYLIKLFSISEIIFGISFFFLSFEFQFIQNFLYILFSISLIYSGFVCIFESKWFNNNVLQKINIIISMINILVFVFFMLITFIYFIELSNKIYYIRILLILIIPNLWLFIKNIYFIKEKK